MTDAPTAAQSAISPSAGPIQRATLDMARSVMMAAGTPLIAHSYLSGSQEEAIIGGVLAVGSAVWSYLAAHPSKVSALRTVLGIVSRGGQARAWDGDVDALGAALLPFIEKTVDARISARAGILSGPLDAAANAAIRDGEKQAEAAASIPLS
jgi:hypothetical protein